MEHCTVTLRAIRDEDQLRMLEILTDTTVNKTYMLPDFASKEDAIPLFNRLKTLSEDPGRFVRAIVAGKQVAGFLNDVEITDSFIELGYVIHPDSQGRGYMTAALRAAIQALFEKGHTQVICGAFEHNLASMRVMEKAGMTRLEKTDEIEYRGKVHRCIYYGITK